MSQASALPPGDVIVTAVLDELTAMQPISIMFALAVVMPTTPPKSVAVAPDAVSGAPSSGVVVLTPE